MKTLVIGSGIAGITASLDIAEAGGDVILIEKEHFATGTLASLDRQFPNDACGFCQVYPFTGDGVAQYCIRRVFTHPGIEVRTGTEVVSIEGEGPYTVKLRRKPRGVVIEKCISCRKCEDVCPVETEDSFNRFGKRKAIYTDYPMPFPQSYAIDWEACTKCGECVKVCPTDAIDLNMVEGEEVIEVDRIITTTGFEEVDPSLIKEYGYQRFKNVLTGLEFERLLSFFGPTLGELKRPSDGKKPERIAFLQCVGSRDIRNPLCSYTCCMYALKEMHLLKRFHPDVEAVMFYMDIRAFGKGYYKYFLETDGKFIPQRVAGIEEDENGNLILKYEDENGRFITDVFDMVVLATGQKPSKDSVIERDELGYPVTEPFVNVKTRNGILVAGSSGGPKDIADAVIEAHSAALEVVKDLTPRTMFRNEPEVFEEPSIGVVLCDCGGTMDVSGLEERLGSKGTPVLKVSDLCINREPVLQWIKENKLDRVVFAACAPSFLDPVFMDSGINYEVADIREGGLWGGSDENALNFRVDAAFRMLENRMYTPSEDFEPAKKVLVVGGGITGMVASLELADAGLDVVLVEKREQLGGNANRIKKLLTGENVQDFLNSLIERVKSHEHIEVRTGENLQEIKGSLGNFTVRISGAEERFGAVLIATGGKEYKPGDGEYGFGRSERVISQMDFEDVIEKEDLKSKTIVMIQCVGSRNDEHPWCSRVCCTDAIKNALRVKEKFPDADVFILYRDIMAYGRKEAFYTRAREKGVIFLRFTKGNEPVVETENGLRVKIFDTVLREEVAIDADFVILSTGIVPDNDVLRGIGIELTEEGFVKEANVKFKPLETPRPGIYTAGLAHSPRDIPESIAQARGVASQIIGVLKKERIVSKRQISYTKERKCAGCGFCIDVCPYDARYLDEERKVAVVYPHICQGCGTCAGICPSGAADMKEMGYREMFSVMDLV